MNLQEACDLAVVALGGMAFIAISIWMAPWSRRSTTPPAPVCLECGDDGVVFAEGTHSDALYPCPVCSWRGTEREDMNRC